MALTLKSLQALVFIISISQTAASSIDKFCGNGNEIKEIVFSFDKYEGTVNDEMLWNDTTMPPNKDTILWLTYLETDKKLATIGQLINKTNLIKFDEIKTSIGYVCKSDGSMAISIGDPNNHDVIIGFQELWPLESNRKHTLRYNTKNNGKLTLSVYLYSKCQAKCQREIGISFNGKDVHGIRYREMDIVSFNGGGTDQFALGKSCELNADIRIYKTESFWDFEVVSVDELTWKEGEYAIYAHGNVVLGLGDRSNICGLLGEDNASFIIILSIISLVLIALLLLYLQIRGKIYDFDEWVKIQAQLNEIEREKYGGNIRLTDIGNVVIIRKEFDGNDIEYISVHIGQTVTILERIDDKYVKVKLNGVKINHKSVVGLIPQRCFN